MMIRGIVISVLEGLIKRCTFSGRQGEQNDNRRVSAALMALPLARCPG